jgi:hypothetical protein
MVLRAPPASAKPEPKPEAGKDPMTTTSTSVGKAFGDTVVNPEMMQTHGPNLREAARQAAAAPPPPPAAPTVAPPAPPPAAAAQAAAPALGTATQPGPVHAPTPSMPPPPAAPGASPQPLGTIQILSGPSAGKELPLSKPLTTLGKPGVQVAVIAKRPQGYFITHVEGATFPVVNGKQLDAQAHPLHDHDVIELAGVKMEFYLKPA